MHSIGPCEMLTSSRWFHSSSVGSENKIVEVEKVIEFKFVYLCQFAIYVLGMEDARVMYLSFKVILADFQRTVVVWWIHAFPRRVLINNWNFMTCLLEK